MNGTQQLVDAIMSSLDPNGAPIKLAEIVGGVAQQLEQRPPALYGTVCNLLQTLKHQGRVEYVKGRGSGWKAVRP